MTRIDISYANYHDCQKYGVENLPWEWGKYWILNEHPPRKLIVATIVNEPSGNFLDIYKRIEQPHIFHNIIFGDSSNFPAYIKLDRRNLRDRIVLTTKINQVVSWDSAFIFMNSQEKMHLWECLNAYLDLQFSFTITLLKMLNVDAEVVEFLRSPFLKPLNHVYQKEIGSSDFEEFNRLFPLVSEAEKKSLFLSEKNIIDFDQLMSIPYFDIINPNSFPDPEKAKIILSPIKLSYIGMHFQIDQ